MTTRCTVSAGARGVSTGGRSIAAEGDECGDGPEKLRTLNRSHYVDYQDCKYAGSHRMLCSGVTEMRQSPTAAPFRLGGLDLVDLRDGRPIHQVPVLPGPRPGWT